MRDVRVPKQIRPDLHDALAESKSATTLSGAALALYDRRRAVQQRVQVRPRQVATIHHDERGAFRMLDIF